MESGVMSLAVGGGGAQLPGGSPPSSPASDSSEGWFNALALGCGDSPSDPNSVLTCMQSINMISIIIVTTEIGFHSTADSISVFSDYTSLTASGKFSKNPFLIGSNNHETGEFEALASLTATNTSDIIPESTWIAIDNAVFVCPVPTRANTSAWGVTPESAA